MNTSQLGEQMYALEKYSGSTSRYACPRCGAKKRFTRYVDSESGRYLADHVGRCDRESSCGYHFKPRDYYAERGQHRPMIQDRLAVRYESVLNRKMETNRRKRHLSKASFIDKTYLIETLSDYERNAFVQYLLLLFPFDPDVVWSALYDYLIGTFKSSTLFPQIDQDGKVRTGKLIEYDPITGRRRKDLHPNWLHSVLQRSGELADDFDLQQCIFGEHLLVKYPDRPIAITEAEKSAVIASICKGVFPAFVWLAAGGKSNLTVDKLARLGSDKTIVLYPDTDAFDRWASIASEARSKGIRVIVSDLIESGATNDERSKGWDLADYLIREQRKRNDPVRREAFRVLIEERLAIMTMDGNLSDDDAERRLIHSGYYEDVNRLVTHY